MRGFMLLLTVTGLWTSSAWAGSWVVETATGRVMDYSPDGSITYDPRYFQNHVDIDLPAGDQPQQYRWNGIQIVKLPPPPPPAVCAPLQAALADPTVPGSIKAYLTARKGALGC